MWSGGWRGPENTTWDFMCCGQRYGLSSQEEAKLLAGLEQDAQVHCSKGFCGVQYDEPVT